MHVCLALLSRCHASAKEAVETSLIPSLPGHLPDSESTARSTAVLKNDSSCTQDVLPARERQLLWPLGAEVMVSGLMPWKSPKASQSAAQWPPSGRLVQDKVHRSNLELRGEGDQNPSEP